MNCGHCGGIDTVVIAEGRRIGTCVVCHRSSAFGKAVEVRPGRRTKATRPCEPHVWDEGLPSPRLGMVRQACRNCTATREVSR